MSTARLYAILFAWEIQKLIDFEQAYYELKRHFARTEVNA